MIGKTNTRIESEGNILEPIISGKSNDGSNSVVEPELSKGDKNIIESGSNHFSTHLYARIAEAAPSDVQRIAATQIELLIAYYNEILSQAKKSFNWALIAAGVGLIFFIFSVVVLIAIQNVDISIISALCGLIIEFISAINFYLYNRATLQMAIYQERLDRTQRFLLANSLCEGLEGETKLKSRSNLIDIIARTTYSSDLLRSVTDKDIKKNKEQGEPNASDRQAPEK